MAIELVASSVRAGEELRGRLEGVEEPTEVKLVRAESGMSTATSSRGATTTTAADGSFTIGVPYDAAPTLNGRRLRVSWNVEVSRGRLRTPHRSEIVVLPPHGRGSDDLHVGYEPGGRPKMIPALRNEHFLSIFMAVCFAGMWLALAVAINVGESEASATATRNVTIGAVLISLIPLGVLFLAVRTIWPRSVRGFEPRIEPTVCSPGDAVTISSTGSWPDDVRFLCVETYDRIYVGSHHARRRASQFETFEHSEIPLRSDSDVAAFRVPADAARSYDGERVQIRWVIRRGGSKIGRWGPIRLREWAIVVVD